MMKRISSLALLFMAVSAVAAPLKIGWAMNDVSTDKPIYLEGTDDRRVSQGVRDPVMTTALVIDNGEDCVIFNSWDTCFVQGMIAERVRAEVAKRLPGFPVEKIVFHATHTHTGPAIGENYKDPVSNEYRDFFIARSADAIIRAWNSRKPGKIGFGYDFAVTCFSRRTVYFDDLRKRPVIQSGLNLWGTICGVYVDKYARVHGNSNDPMFSHMEAAPDPFVNFLFTYDMNDKLTGMIFNIAFPTQISLPDKKLNADCWGDIRRELKKEFGDGVYVLPQCAAAGDLTYKIPYYDKATKRKYRLLYGRKEKFPREFERIRCTEQMMAALHRTLPWASKKLYSDLPLRHIKTTLHLKRCYATPEDIEDAKIALAKLDALKKNPPWTDPAVRKKAMVYIRVAEWRTKRVLTLNEQIKKKPTWDMEFHVLRIGEVAFVSERYELYTDFGQRIQARSPFTQTFTVQLSVGGPDLPWFAACYLATARSFKNAGYQSHPVNNAYSPSPEGGQQMVDEAVRLLYELKKDDQKAETK